MANSAILIDTSVLIEYFRKQNKEKTAFYRLSLRNVLSISTITEFEFRIGISPKYSAFANHLLSNLISIPFDSACAINASQIYTSLKTQNQLIPPPDIFIAATALTYNMPLSTLNRKHFSRIRELQIIKL